MRANGLSYCSFRHGFAQRLVASDEADPASERTRSESAHIPGSGALEEAYASTDRGEDFTASAHHDDTATRTTSAFEETRAARNPTTVRHVISLRYLPIVFLMSRVFL